MGRIVHRLQSLQGRATIKAELRAEFRSKIDEVRTEMAELEARIMVAISNMSNNSQLTESLFKPLEATILWASSNN